MPTRAQHIRYRAIRVMIDGTRAARPGRPVAQVHLDAAWKAWVDRVVPRFETPDSADGELDPDLERDLDLVEATILRAMAH